MWCPHLPAANLKTALSQWARPARSSLALSVGSYAQALVAAALLLSSGWSLAAPLSDAQALVPVSTQSHLQTLQLRQNFYLIGGAGENIAVQTGPDGAVVVDAGAANHSNEVLSAIQKISPNPIRYVIDTSADPEAVGGNGALAKAGRSIYFMGTQYLGPAGLGEEGRWATILARDEVLLRMSAPTGRSAPFPMPDWPTEAVTLANTYIYFNSEAAEIFAAPAHDSTDTIVFFRASDVILAGDIINANRFPTIDVPNGGSIQGEISALNRILDLSDTSLPFAWRNGGTYIIPSYGHVYLLADVGRYRDMVVQISEIIESMIKRKMNLQQIEAASPCLAYQGEFGATSGPWTTNDFVKAVYESLIKSQHGSTVK